MLTTLSTLCLFFSLLLSSLQLNRFCYFKLLPIYYAVRECIRNYWGLTESCCSACVCVCVCVKDFFVTVYSFNCFVVRLEFMLFVYFVLFSFLFMQCFDQIEPESIISACFLNDSSLVKNSFLSQKISIQEECKTLNYLDAVKLYI